MVEVRDKMDRACVDTGKAIKVASKLQGAAQAVDMPSKALQRSLADLEECLENCEKVAHNLGFCAKFRKTTEGEPLTYSLAQSTQRDACSKVKDLRGLAGGRRLSRRRPSPPPPPPLPRTPSDNWSGPPATPIDHPLRLPPSIKTTPCVRSSVGGASIPRSGHQ